MAAPGLPGWETSRIPASRSPMNERFSPGSGLPSPCSPRVALEAFVEDLQVVLRRTIAIVLILTGVWCSVAAFVRWMANERALRLGRPLPAARLAPFVARGGAARRRSDSARPMTRGADEHPAGWDSGAQNERSALAWTRSTLAPLGVSLVVARIAYGEPAGVGHLPGVRLDPRSDAGIAILRATVPTFGRRTGRNTIAGWETASVPLPLNGRARDSRRHPRRHPGLRRAPTSAKR